jgi:hypothetical protein
MVSLWPRPDQQRGLSPKSRRSSGASVGVGVAHATGKCALVHKIGFRPPWTPPDQEPVRCRAEPDRKGRVGVAHAIRICALVRNTSQARSSDPTTTPSFRAGEHPATGRDQGLSLGRTQRPSCHTMLPTKAILPPPPPPPPKTADPIARPKWALLGCGESKTAAHCVERRRRRRLRLTAFGIGHPNRVGGIVDPGG